MKGKGRKDPNIQAPSIQIEMLVIANPTISQI
jgi:hypothetical protein